MDGSAVSESVNDVTGRVICVTYVRVGGKRATSRC